MKITSTIKSARKEIGKARSQGKRIGLVPTMGALHEGHLSLIRKARRQCDYVAVSIFVNPTQFGASEDLAAYPRPFRRDCRICRKEKVDLVFSPPEKEMYPQGYLTFVQQEKGLIEKLCGASRPIHFRGVMTVVTKLFNIIEPDVAYFGQKDAQQSVIIRKMASDLNQNVKIVVCPTVRASDGLAVSSRNKYLDAKERKEATALFSALQLARTEIRHGQSDAALIVREMKNLIRKRTSGKIEYVNVVDAATLEDVKKSKGDVLIALAVKIGRARLIEKKKKKKRNRRKNAD